MMRYIFIVPFLGILVLFLSYAGSGRKAPTPGELVEVELMDVGVDPNSRSPVLILIDNEKGHVLPVFIGIHEASAITKGLSQDKSPRPLTHDLIVNMIDELGGSLSRVVIKDLKDNVFYADLVLFVKDSEIQVDCRPSDAIAVAVRLGAPIYVTRDVLESSFNEELTNWWHREGTISRIGLRLQKLTEELAAAMGVEGVEGVIVSSIKDGAAADEAGIERGDILLSLDGVIMKDPADVTLALTEKEGQVIEVSVLRKGEQLLLKISVPAYGEEGPDEP